MIFTIIFCQGSDQTLSADHSCTVEISINKPCEMNVSSVWWMQQRGWRTIELWSERRDLSLSPCGTEIVFSPHNGETLFLCRHVSFYSSMCHCWLEIHYVVLLCNSVLFLKVRSWTCANIKKPFLFKLLSHWCMTSWSSNSLPAVSVLWGFVGLVPYHTAFVWSLDSSFANLKRSLLINGTSQAWKSMKAIWTSFLPFFLLVFPVPLWPGSYQLFWGFFSYAERVEKWKRSQLKSILLDWNVKRHSETFKQNKMSKWFSFHCRARTTRGRSRACVAWFPAHPPGAVGVINSLTKTFVQLDAPHSHETLSPSWHAQVLIWWDHGEAICCSLQINISVCARMCACKHSCRIVFVLPFSFHSGQVSRASGEWEFSAGEDAN